MYKTAKSRGGGLAKKFLTKRLGKLVGGGRKSRRRARRARRKERRSRRQARRQMRFEARQDRRDRRTELRLGRKRRRVENEDASKNFIKAMKPVVAGVSEIGEYAIKSGTDVAKTGIDEAANKATDYIKGTPGKSKVDGVKDEL